MDSGEDNTPWSNRGTPRPLRHPDRAGIALYRLGDVLKEFRDADLAVAVAVARASECLPGGDK